LIVSEHVEFTVVLNKKKQILSDLKRKSGYYLSIVRIIITGGVVFLSDCEKDLYSPAGSVKDVDGNIYTSVKIGKQTWLGENLKTTKYKNGILIPYVIDGFQWTNLTTGAFCYYDDSQINRNIYGNLYNWYTVKTGNLCPDGWHVPSDTEWKKLEEYLGRSYDAGGRLKEAGTEHWEEPNYGGINSSGFSALPAGSFSTSIFGGSLSSFIGINTYAGFWSSTEADVQTATERSLSSDDHVLGSWNEAKYSGLSVRCLKDN
jgi:uncharacterized protein (TIGR02145 family)